MLTELHRYERASPTNRITLTLTAIYQSKWIVSQSVTRTNPNPIGDDPALLTTITAKMWDTYEEAKAAYDFARNVDRMPAPH